MFKKIKYVFVGFKNENNLNGRIVVEEMNTLRISRDISENMKVRIMSEKRLVTYGG